MAASKRKENPNSSFQIGGNPKKPKKEEKLANGTKQGQDLETATSVSRTIRPTTAPKRPKEIPTSKFNAGSTPEKARKEEKRVQELETATDSDPILESDTASQSGDDDGVSWPSDEDAEAGEGWEGFGVAEDDDEGGVEFAAEAAGASQSAKKASITNGTASGMSEQSTNG